MSDVSLLNSSDYDEEEDRYYPNNAESDSEPSKTFILLRSLFVILVVCCALSAFGMSVWLMVQVKNNIIQEIEILEESSKRSMKDILTDNGLQEISDRALYASAYGLTVRQQGTKLLIIVPQENVGLSVQKIADSHYVVANSGTVSIVPGGGISAAPAPLTARNTEIQLSEKDTRATTYLPQRVTIRNTGVTSTGVATAAKRDVFNAGLENVGTDSEVLLKNTGVLTTSVGTGMLDTSDDAQNPVLSVANPFIFVTSTILASDLASGAGKVLYTASSATATYRIFSLATLVTGSTNFGTGDRIMMIGTTAEQKWFISATALATVGSNSLVPGNSNTGIQASTTSDAISDTTAGRNIIAQYTGGSSDYATGTVVINMILVQTNY